MATINITGPTGRATQTIAQNNYYNNTDRTTKSDTNEKTRILLVFANPRYTEPLLLSREERTIRAAIGRSKGRDSFEISTCPAATIDDLREALLDNDYRIVQISGHGSTCGLMFEDETGQPNVIAQEALAELFAAHARPEGQLECVILNACYSMTQGTLISLGVGYTIAMEGRVYDSASIEFSRGFYDGIGAGKSVEFSYREGVRSVTLKKLHSSFRSKIIPQKKKHDSDSGNPEEVISPASSSP